MAEVHRLPDKDTVEREASEWIARLNADDASADDRALFEVWRKAHPLHARTHDELAVTWHVIEAAGPMVRAVSLAQELNEISDVRESRRRWTFTAMAATVVLAIIGTWYALRAPEVVYQTAVGQYSVVTLPDGSTLELNTDSVARLQYSRRARVVRLDRGEGFFRVAHDTTRPFWVVVGDSWVRAVGTEFDVHRRDVGVQVTVSEGVVKIGHADVLEHHGGYTASAETLPASVLRAGQQADMQSAFTAIRSMSSDQIARSIAWRGGSVYFEDQPLSEVVAELSRYTKMQLVLEDESLRDLHIGGTFQSNEGGVESFVNMLRDGLGLQVRREEKRIYIEHDPNRSSYTSPRRAN